MSKGAQRILTDMNHRAEVDTLKRRITELEDENQVLRDQLKELGAEATTTKLVADPTITADAPAQPEDPSA